ncbi:MAG: translation initiation factor IF-2 [Candidatus Cryptobacteroides sp.]|jgi:translation initiation factor IF-2|nr:translation initiation factor IF-2 [Rikenellaceae bacterium]
MAEIRINKIMRQFNIGLNDLVDFLHKQGAEVEANPNAKISDEYLPFIEKQFGADLKAAQEAKERAIKMSDILEQSGRKAEEPEDEEPESVTIIRTTTFAHKREESVPEPAPEVAKEVAPESAPEPAPAPAPEPVAATIVKPEAKPEADPETAPEVAGPAKQPEMVEPEKPLASEKAKEPSKKPDAEVASEKPQATEKPAAPAKKTPEKKVASAEEPAAPAKEEPKKAAQPEAESVAAEKPAAEQKPAPSSTAKAGKDAPGKLKVLGKIDLSQFEKKPTKKRERINKGTQKVDVAKAGQNISRNQGRDRNQQSQQNAGKGRRSRERFKPAMSESEIEEMQKEIQKQVKETYAKMNEPAKKTKFGAKYRKEKRELAAQRTQEERSEAMADKKVLKVTEFVTVNDLAVLMNNTPVNKVIGTCMNLGLMVSINQRLDAEALVLVAEEFGYKVEFIGAELTNEIESIQEADRPEDLEERPPVITVMGHVDHGKTSLLDYIRKANVIAGEEGGITQHIGAYNVRLESGRRITFLDTPGHEAFTAMRARGAQMTDLVIIIIAADDAVMPQTVEAINHAQAAGVPMVFAINKIDKPGAEPEKIYQQLSQMNILTEAWGGKYQSQEISAKKGLNVDKLLEKVLLEADVLELKANPNKLASGAIIESSLDKGRGYLATLLVQEGTLRQGDVILTGSYYGRIKNMFNERGQVVQEAGPSNPVSVLGLNGAPAAGEKFNVMQDEREAKNIAGKREQLIRIQGIKTQKHLTLEEIGRRISIGNFKELNIIVKGDMDGTVEALSDELIKLSTEEIRVNVIHKAVGAISESDILLADASDAIIIGFQVRPTVEARRAAEREGIEIRLYSVIYDAIKEVKDSMEGMLEPEEKEEVIATAEVKQLFHISRIGTIAGCIMREGKMVPKAQVRLIRDGIVIYTGVLASLKIGKDDVKEVAAGKECGMSIANFNDIKEGDFIEAFKIVEIKRTL